MTAGCCAAAGPRPASGARRPACPCARPGQARRAWRPEHRGSRAPPRRRATACATAGGGPGGGHLWTGLLLVLFGCVALLLRLSFLAATRRFPADTSG